ncbi:hypothetical protein L7F22_047464 [Adiantum nelumboides]|nr:hypothetical protein [Adiantum nelumboides]
MPSPSKRVTRASDKKEEVAKPTPQDAMEDAAKDKKVGKPRGPPYKLKREIEMTTDLQKVFEERILNSRVELTLGELLGIAKPEFHAKFSDMIKRKRQIPIEAESENPSKAQHTEVVVGRWFRELDEDELRTVVESNIKQVHFNDEAEKFLPRSYFSRAHWARATTETVVTIGDFDEPVVALVDSGSEINIMSKSLYLKGNWPIETEHGWRIKAANTAPGDLYGACPNVKVTIGDVSDEQNFFVQEYSSYPLILGQPFITAVSMETKVLDDGSTYARIRSKDGKKAVHTTIFDSLCEPWKKQGEP